MRSKFFNFTSNFLKNSYIKLSLKTTTIFTSGLFISYKFSQDSNNCIADSIFSTSKVFTWGFNRYGQLGVGSEENESLPTYIEALSNIQYISCGAEQTAAIDNNGKLYTFGRGADARLGHGLTGGLNETYPRMVEELSNENIVQVCAGYNHMGCVTDDGKVYTFGKNTYKQLGHGNGSYPTLVKTLLDMNVYAIKVSCGRYHTMVLDNKGNCYGFGGRKYGETGIQKQNVPTPTKVSGLSDINIIDICCGNDFTIFLDNNGNVYSTGANNQGQLGLGALKDKYISIPMKINELKNVIKIAAGEFHVIALTKDGSVYTWGLNQDGQLGHGDTQNRTKPTKLHEFDNKNIEAINITAGGGHTGVLVLDKNKNKKQLYVFGRGRQGQIGRANQIESIAMYRATPVIVDFFDDLKNEIYQIDFGGKHSAAVTV